MSTTQPIVATPSWWDRLHGGEDGFLVAYFSLRTPLIPFKSRGFREADSSDRSAVAAENAGSAPADIQAVVAWGI